MLTWHVPLYAATAFLERAANYGTIGRQISEQLHIIGQKWDSLYFGEVTVKTVENFIKFDVQVYLNDLDPDNVQVELFADGIKGESPFIQKMVRGEKLTGKCNGYNYFVSVDSGRLASDYTARVIPYFPNVSVPLEISRISWQR